MAQTATQIQHELISSLRIAAGYRLGSLQGLHMLLTHRQELAKIMLEEGPTEQSKQLYHYMNQQIATILGIANPAKGE